ncbi:hypothetical protein TRVA0_023S01706 [Trichomonascus vanleenenianus]|uniref:uncharacterized protein n=1 Tax=Trichomonascus vanleenenianus TaxID=2268995 RepID=UPI003ECA678D
MVKLSAIFLFLAVVSALGCELSSIGQNIVTDINNIISGMTYVQGKTATFTATSTGSVFIVGFSQTYGDVTYLITHISTTGVNDCDFQALISGLADITPAINTTLQAFVDKMDIFAQAKVIDYITQRGLTPWNSIFANLISTIYPNIAK